MIIYDQEKSVERRDAYDWRIDMLNNNGVFAEVIRLPKANRKKRKQGVNLNREGSVRNINGTVYVDFIYLDERVRETTGLVWNTQNVRLARQQLDNIIVAINSGTFKFSEVFLTSSRREYFAEKERLRFGFNKAPNEVCLRDYFDPWFVTVTATGRITGRTQRDYKSYLKNYLKPFFENYTFADLNKALFEKFVAWARSLKLLNKVISNKTINNILSPLKLICKEAAIEFNWGPVYNPFFGFKKLKEDDPYEKINPFSLKEQQQILEHMPEHYKPYTKFAFCCGMRHGEQTGLKPEDIDWIKAILRVRRGITLDENSKIIEGRAKNAYSRRTIKLTPYMLEILNEQKAIHEKHHSTYLFCTPEGKLIDLNNFRNRTWKKALKDAGVPYRDLKQTRHSFATTALSNGVNPLFIAKMMGHRNTQMIINVYSRYVDDNENDGGTDPNKLDAIFCLKDEK